MQLFEVPTDAKKYTRLVGQMYNHGDGGGGWKMFSFPRKQALRLVHALRLQFAMTDDEMCRDR